MGADRRGHSPSAYRDLAAGGGGGSSGTGGATSAVRAAGCGVVSPAGEAGRTVSADGPASASALTAARSISAGPSNFSSPKLSRTRAGSPGPTPSPLPHLRRGEPARGARPPRVIATLPALPPVTTQATPTGNERRSLVGVDPVGVLEAQGAHAGGRRWGRAGGSVPRRSAGSCGYPWGFRVPARRGKRSSWRGCCREEG